MTEAELGLVEVLLVTGAALLVQMLRRKHTKTETGRSGQRPSLRDLIPPSDWNGFLRLVMFISVGISAIWLVLLGLISCESILWAAKQLTGVPAISKWILAVASLSMVLPWIGFAKASRRLGFVRWLNSSFTTPTIGAALRLSLIAGSGVAVWFLLTHYDLLSWA